MLKLWKLIKLVYFVILASNFCVCVSFYATISKVNVTDIDGFNVRPYGFFCASATQKMRSFVKT